MHSWASHALTFKNHIDRASEVGPQLETLLLHKPFDLSSIDTLLCTCTRTHNNVKHMSKGYRIYLKRAA